MGSPVSCFHKANTKFIFFGMDFPVKIRKITYPFTTDTMDESLGTSPMTIRDIEGTTKYLAAFGNGYIHIYDTSQIAPDFKFLNPAR
jgi:hypothetical protein